MGEKKCGRMRVLRKVYGRILNCKREEDIKVLQYIVNCLNRDIFQLYNI